MPSPYEPHDRFVAPARPAAELWRLIPGIGLLFVVALAPIFALKAYLVESRGRYLAEVILGSAVDGATPGGMLLLLWSFLGLALAPMAVVRMLHHRPAGTLLGAPPARVAADGLKVFAALSGLALLILPLTLAGPGVQPGLDLARFLPLLPFALTGLLIQTGAEELVFRGYLQQQLGARFRVPAIWMGLPALAFAWGHHAPDVYGASAPLIAAWAFLFGLAAADLTARTGTLGAAIGFHLANNLAALLLVGVTGNLDGLALWSVSLDLGDPAALRPLLAVDFATLATSWLLARLVLRV